MSAPVGSLMVDPFVYDALPGRVVFGPGRARRDLDGELERLGASRVLLVASDSEDQVAAELSEPWAGRLAERFTGVRPHVPIEVSAAAIDAAREARADCVVTVGGGSTTGTGKAIALELGLPIVAVPTTYAGSEMTPVWGLTSGGHKTTGRSPTVLPKVVIYDPDLTYGLPAAVTAASGMNALAHCVEALYAPGANPITSAVALEGVRALAASIPIAVDQPTDAAARSGALYGAYLAGAAFAVAGSHLHHKICHALGGAFDLPHAETHSVVLPYVVDYFEPALPAVMARVAEAFGAGSSGLSGRRLQWFAAGLGLPVSLAEIGLPSDGVEAVLDAVLAAVPRSTPRPIDRDGLRRLLTAAAQGAPL